MKNYSFSQNTRENLIASGWSQIHVLSEERLQCFAQANEAAGLSWTKAAGEFLKDFGDIHLQYQNKRILRILESSSISPDERKRIEAIKNKKMSAFFDPCDALDCVNPFWPSRYAIHINSPISVIGWDGTGLIYMMSEIGHVFGGDSEFFSSLGNCSEMFLDNLINCSVKYEQLESLKRNSENKVPNSNQQK
jgi:hypothetical protein